MDPVRWVALGAAVLLADKVLGFFTPDNPGGNVTPGTGDDRPATMNEAEARALADRIEADVWGTGVVEAWFEDDEDFAATLTECKVTNDVRLLMNVYGNRGTHFVRPNLTETVVEYLDAEFRDAVNENYRRKGINIRF